MCVCARDLRKLEDVGRSAAAKAKVPRTGRGLQLEVPEVCHDERVVNHAHRWRACVGGLGFGRRVSEWVSE